jgi:uncharacterized membrane protein
MYNDVVANGAERILAMAERQSAHRESMEAQVVKANLALQRQGSWFAFILAFLTIGGGIFLIYLGKDGYGLAAIAPLTSLAGVFFFSKREQRKERVEKATALEARRRK